MTDRDTLRDLTLPATTDNRHSGVNHYCIRCGQCLCDCKNCAVFYPCCCRACWEATAPVPPRETVHNCICTPAAAS